MVIHGIGIDLVETARIADSIARFGERFLARVFTARERAYCGPNKHADRHYAARFAAKEAVAKAFGTGIGADADWTEIEILRRPSGEPEVHLHGTAAAYAAQQGITRVLISLTHADSHAAAQAVALREV